MYEKEDFLDTMKTSANEAHILFAEVKRLTSERDNAVAEGRRMCMELMKERDRLRFALAGILEIGKRDMTNSKYDGYFQEALEALGEK